MPRAQLANCPNCKQATLVHNEEKDTHNCLCCRWTFHWDNKTKRLAAIKDNESDD